MCETKRLNAVKHRPELAGEELAELLVVRHGGMLLLLLDLWVIKVHHLGGGCDYFSAASTCCFGSRLACCCAVCVSSCLTIERTRSFFFENPAGFLLKS